MIPISDDNRGRHSQPYVIYALIAINTVIFLYQQTLSPERLMDFVTRWGAIPAEVSSGRPAEWLTLVTCVFLHGSWLHLIGNMLFLWIFGDNVEDVMGHLPFLAFYLITGVLASGAQVLIDSSSHVPAIGASGAIAGVLAAYIVCFPRGRVNTLIFLGVFLTMVMLPAWLMIGVWIVIQLISGFVSFGIDTAQTGGGGVAYFAHIGGFIAGLLLVKLFASDHRLADQRAARSTQAESRRLSLRG